MQTVVERFTWIICLLMLSATLAAAQTPVTLSGTVTTRADGLSVPGATVTLVGTNLMATTDTAGKYTLDIPPALARTGKVQIKVDALSLPSETYDVELAANAPTTFDVAVSLGFEEMVTVGSRTRGAEAEKSVPVDILSKEQIAASGYAETAQVIQSLAPSFNFPRPTITDGTDTVRPATLRGLGPDQVLVLINGKRRHQSALVHLNGSIGRGSTGVDLNAIPLASIELIDVGGSWGAPLGAGSLTLSAEYRHHNRTNRASFDPRDQIVAGDAGNNAVAQPNHRWGDPDTRDLMTLLNYNVPLNDQQTRFFYAFGGYSRREANSAGFFRRASDARNWPQIYPVGFLPEIQPTVVDGSAAAGVRGAWNQWAWDLSGEYGHNSFDFTIGNTLNVSLGPAVPPNKTVFDAGTLALGQLVANADISRAFRIGALSGPLNVAFGTEVRREAYEITAGEPDSYRNGGVPNQAEGLAAI